MTTRSVTSHIPSADVELQATASPWMGLLSLWRYGVWFAVLFGVLVLAVSTRIAVRQSVLDLERNASLTREAILQQERLQLEVHTRRRAVLLEAYAAEMELTAGAPLVTP